MGTSRGNNTPKTVWGKRRKSQLKLEKRLEQNRQVINNLKQVYISIPIFIYMKLKDYMPKGFEMGRVYSNPYHTAFAPIKEETIKEDDHEVGMGLSSLKSSVRSAKTIYEEMKKRDVQELEGWVQEKLTLASDYLKTVADYMVDLDEYEK